MSSERCCWPGCHFSLDGFVEGKSLCEKHCSLVLSEDSKVGDRSRAKIGLKPRMVVRGSEVAEKVAEKATEKVVETDNDNWESRFAKGEFE